MIKTALPTAAYRRSERTEPAFSVLAGKGGTILRHLVLIFFSLVVLFPFLWMFFAAFKPEEDVFLPGFHLLPSRWVFTNFADAWNAAPFLYFFRNSLVCAAIVVGSQLITCSLAAYGLAKMNFRGRTLLFSLLIASMMVPGEASIIPNFLLAKNLHLLDSFLGLAMPSLTSVFGIFLMRQSFMSIPDDLLNAAKIDGCNELGAFWHVGLPCAKSSLATLSIFGFLGAWNEYMWPMIVTNKNNMRTLQIGLKYMISPDLGPQWPMIMAASTMILLPVLLLFVCLQKYFIDGMVHAGIK